MIDIVRAKDRHFTDFGWLKTYWLFSFSNYYDPGNIQFGALRVFNDDVVEPSTGFPTHPHREMEIVTIVLDGEITHKDSMGNQSVIRAGDVQRMSAGTGLSHSEFNHGSKPVHFYQIWIYPDESKLEPSYDQKSFDPSLWSNRLYAVASGEGHEDAVSFHADATIYRCSLEAGKEVDTEPGTDRRIFVYVTAGAVSLNGEQLTMGDQARVDLEDRVRLVAEDDSEFILIDIPSCKGYGYDSRTLEGSRAK